MVKKGREPYLPAEYTPGHVLAMQHLSKGVATQDEQIMALDWIIKQAAKTYDLSYRPGGLEGQRDSDFASGRSFAGQQIVKLLSLDFMKLKEKT